MNKYIIASVIVVIIVFGWIAFRERNSFEEMSENGAATLINSAVYMCDGGKTISAAFYDDEAGAAETAPGDMPHPTGSAEVSLDGAASTTLHQTISADGARYANADESFVFWSKGDSALIMRDNSMDLNYTNCSTTASAPSVH